MSSRIFWVGVGAVGGIVVYRRGHRALEQVRARGVVGNVAAVAGAVSRVAAAAAGLPRADVEPLPLYVDHSVRSLESIEVTPVRRIPLRRRRTGVPATALRLDALSSGEPVIDVREAREVRTATAS